VTLAAITYPLTILHGAKGDPEQLWDCPAGVRKAHSLGATAIDVNGQHAVDGTWMADHWRFPGSHGFTGPHKEEPIDRLTPEQIATFVSTARKAKGFRIVTMREVFTVAASLGMTVTVEAKAMGDFTKLRADAEATGCKVIVSTLPHLGGKNVGYQRLAAAKAAGLPTMVLLNTTKYARGQVPADQWQHVDYVKGPTIWQKDRPARVIRLGGGSKYGVTVTPGNARRVTARLRKQWPATTPPKGTTVPATVAQALNHCADQSAHGPKFGVNECKIQCRTAYRVPSDGSATAAIAAGRADLHPIPANIADIPDGALLWWLGGTPTKNHPQGAGHVAIKRPGVNCWSTDFRRAGFFDSVPVLDIAKRWTKLRLVGWSPDIDGVKVLEVAPRPTPAPKPKPKPETPTQKRMRPSAYSLGAKGAHVTWLGQRLVAHGFGRFYKSGPGPEFTAADKRAVAAFQKAQGWTGKDADGLPGAETLKRLAKAPAKKAARKPAKKTGKVADYSFARPDPAALKAAGFEGVMRYISPSSKKNLTKAEAKRLHDAGLWIGLIWETTAARAGEGARAGADDVKWAEAAADKLGLPMDCPIFFAVDFDAPASKVRPYFTAVKKGAKRPTGSYGGVKIAAAGLTDYIWQTEAWSHGEVATNAHMLQRIHPTLKVKGAASGWDENDLLKPIPTWRP
jgi:hypothetical protein